MGGIILSRSGIDFLRIEISPIMRAAVVSDISNMQWAIDVITLSNSRRWGNHKLFEDKRDSCIEKVKQLPMTLSKINQQKEMIIDCCRPGFWEDASESDLDEVIEHLMLSPKNICLYTFGCFKLTGCPTIILLSHHIFDGD